MRPNIPVHHDAHLCGHARAAPSKVGAGTAYCFKDNTICIWTILKEIILIFKIYEISPKQSLLL